MGELTLQSANIGTWFLKIDSEVREKEYTYEWDGKTKTGKRFDCTLMSTNSMEYCLGSYRRRGREPKASEDFQNAKRRFKPESIWRVAKVTLLKEKAAFISAPVKIVIDLQSTRCAPIPEAAMARMPEPQP